MSKLTTEEAINNVNEALKLIDSAWGISEININNIKSNIEIKIDIKVVEAITKISNVLVDSKINPMQMIQTLLISLKLIIIGSPFKLDKD